MNISLSAAASKASSKSGKVVGVGLNRRGSETKSNVLGGGDDDSDEDNNDEVSGRGTVNRELLAEQAALRKRAAAAAAGKDLSVYDYDGAYDDDKATQQSKEQQLAKDADERKSRYIGDLLKAAEQRKRQRDVVFERKLAKEQEAEAAELNAPEERFITKAYKRKLQERQLWQEQEDARAREEEAKDVTKVAKGGAAWANFYGNLSRNVTLGGDNPKEEKADQDSESKSQQRGENEENTDDDPRNESNPKDPESEKGGEGYAKFSFLEGFEPATGDVDDDNRKSPYEDGKPQRDSGGTKESTIDSTKSSTTESNLSTKVSTTKATSSKAPTLSAAELRKLRNEKVEQARLRYFQRKGMLLGEEGTKERISA